MSLKWIIGTLLCLATMINYADRLALGIVSVEVRREFGLNEVDYGQITALFLLAYAIMYAGSGFIVDRLGTKKGFGVFIFCWSAAQMMHAFTVGKWSLAAARFGLGLAEPGNWPAAAKAVKEWFPPEQRALGVGIFNSGSSLGSALANPVVSYLARVFGWRAAFLFTGAAGLVWLVSWWLVYRTGPYVTDSRPQLAERADWRQIIRKRACWTLILARFFTDPVIYFMIFWLPEYLRKERGFSLEDIGRYLWIPYIFGDVGYLFGGWLSGRLMRSGLALPRCRKLVMAIGAACMPPAILAPLLPEAWMAIAAICSTAFGHGLWTANLQTIPTDVFGDREVGTASGFTGMGGAIGGMLANLGTGYVVSQFSYAPIFLLAGLAHPFAAFLVYRLLPDREFQPEGKY
ncbi:MAG: MFS transporter [Bryobacteraceae bacterium]|nr:MFS transporter [Bryobacteraceae bacterium]